MKLRYILLLWGIFFHFVTFCLLWFPLLTNVTFSFITLRYVHGACPQSFSLIYRFRRRPSYPFYPVPAHNITACGVCINADEVLLSFVVICAPQTYNILNLLPLLYLSSACVIVLLTAPPFLLRYPWFCSLRPIRPWTTCGSFHVC